MGTVRRSGAKRNAITLHKDSKTAVFYHDGKQAVRREETELKATRNGKLKASRVSSQLGCPCPCRQEVSAAATPQTTEQLVIASAA